MKRTITATNTKIVTPGIRNKNQLYETDRWKHDRFDAEEQIPKTTQDIVRLYGYDLRKDYGVRSKPVNNTHDNNMQIKKR